MSKKIQRNYSANQSEIIKQKYFLLFFIYMVLTGCGHYIAPYNETAYQNATDLKVESLALMNNASRPYTDYAQEVQSLMIKVDQAYEFSKGIPKNDLTTKQWQKMLDPKKNMLGGFIKKWEMDGQLNEVFIEEMKEQIAEGFDEIIQLESAKIKE